MISLCLKSSWGCTVCAIDAQSIADVMKDAFLQFQIPLAKLRGQCYHGCSSVAGAKAGVGAENKSLFSSFGRGL